MKRTPIAIVAIIVLLLCTYLPALAQSPAQTTPSIQPPAAAPTPALTPAQKQAEEADAQAFLQKVLSSKSNVLPSPAIFSNRTAAMFGMFMLFPLGLVDSFAKLGPPDEKAKVKEIDQEVNALAIRSGLDMNSKGPASDAEIDKLESHGREFYSEVLALLEKASKEMPGNASLTPSRDSSPSSQLPQDISTYTFTAISPTEVKVTTKDPSSPPTMVVYEDGQWRLDFGGIRDLAKANSQSNGSTANATGANVVVKLTDLSPALPIVPKSLFVSQPSNDQSGYGEVQLIFDDGYNWPVKDKIGVERSDAITDDGRHASVWLGAKADYYHILHTDMVAIRPHNASYPRQDTIDDAINADDSERVADLLAAHPGLANRADDTGTPLISAVFFDRKDIVVLLLHHGAKVNQPNNVGETPLMQAADFDKIDEAKILLAAGAKINLKDDFGHTALSHAREMHNADMVALLKAHGAR